MKSASVGSAVFKTLQVIKVPNAAATILECGYIFGDSLEKIYEYKYYNKLYIFIKF